MGFSKASFIDYREREYHEEFDMSAMLDRLAKERREDKAEITKAQNLAFNQQELARVKHDLKYFKGDDAEKFFQLKAYMKVLSERLRA